MLTVHCLLRDQHDHVRPVERVMGGVAKFHYDGEWSPAVVVASNPDLVLCVNEYEHDVAACIVAARSAGIPTLVLQDGTLEWRCQYHNPIFGAGGGPPQHQPVLSDKIACIGYQSARHIRSWGNSGRVEVTGMPKLDEVAGRRAAVRETRERPRILVMTAKKPWFDEEQRAVVIRSLLDVRDQLRQRDVEVVWRITKNLHDVLGVDNQLSFLTSGELSEVLDEVDAVISTPSTAILEAFLRERPVAALDYHNTPRFVQTAWTISAPHHVEPVIDELLTPAAARLAFQKVCLGDALLCDGPAAPRVARLIEKMAELGRRDRGEGQPLRLPDRLIERLEADRPVDSPKLADLYPNQDVFKETDLVRLQVRLVRTETAYREAKTRLESRTLGYWVQAAGRFLARRVAGRR